MTTIIFNRRRITICSIPPEVLLQGTCRGGQVGCWLLWHWLDDSINSSSNLAAPLCGRRSPSVWFIANYSLMDEFLLTASIYISSVWVNEEVFLTLLIDLVLLWTIHFYVVLTFQLNYLEIQNWLSDINNKKKKIPGYSCKGAVGLK